VVPRDLGGVELEGIALGGGRATGAAHLVDDPALDRGPAQQRSVLVVSRGGWPKPNRVGAGVVGVVLEETEVGNLRVPSVPMVGGLYPDLFREGEAIEVDGDRGRVGVPAADAIEVVTAFLVRADTKVLLLRRSERVGSFRGRWAAVSGFLEDPTPEGQALREVREETGLAAPEVVVERTGGLVYARDGPRIYVVHPFLLRARRAEIRLDWEHTESEWVDPSEIGRRPTVPNLDRAWRAVAPPPLRKS
jgi:8-oxo-dGTP diphosphatase